MSDKSNSGKEETEQAQCCDRGERQGGINSHCGNTVNLYGETGNGNCKDNDELVKSSSTSDGSVESSEVSARYAKDKDKDSQQEYGRPYRRCANVGYKKENANEFELTLSSCGRRMYRFKRFPNNPLIVDSEYELDTIKGFGSYGLVASGRCISTQQEIAIKKISHVFDNLGDARRVLRYIKILKFLRHRNIVGLKGMMSIPNPQHFNYVYLCMYYMYYNLQRLIHSRQVAIVEPMIQFILYQLLNAINFMHSADIIHRDMKPENILVNKKCEIKIADMNLARKETETNYFTYYVTTRPYRAPEIFISNNAYTKAIDIWSIGCILAEMLGKTVLFEGKGYLEQLEKFVAILGKPTIGIFSNMDPIGEQGLIRAFSEIPDRYKIDWHYLFPEASDNVLDLLDHMLVYDAKARFTAEECLNHPFFEEYRNRVRPTCKQVFDFSFDSIETTEYNLRYAIYSESIMFEPRRSRRYYDTVYLGIPSKRVKSSNNTL